ncbi:MAG: DUF4292 domain-containing protein [Candidatus Sumerlaeaceae bacterium]|nr:DUF4292 domain-containing protein [Candidatus Sumerlaeaceae bacterium]
MIDGGPFVRRLYFVIMLFVIAGALPMVTGCGRVRLRPLRQPVPEFTSPIAPVGRYNLQASEVVTVLKQRQRNLRTIRANLNLVLGGREAARQRFDVSMFVQQPNRLRLRGTQEQGTVFDVLINRNDVQAVVYPERRYYRGTLDQLRRNPQVTAGIDPELFFDVLSMEQLLLSRHAAYRQLPMRRDLRHYEVRFDYSNGTSEVFRLRQQDLLIDRYERFMGRNLTAGVTFTGYQLADGHLVPTGFIVDVPAAGGQFGASVVEARPNAPAPETVYDLRVPEGFVERPISQ